MLLLCLTAKLTAGRRTADCGCLKAGVTLNQYWNAPAGASGLDACGRAARRPLTTWLHYYQCLTGRAQLTMSVPVCSRKGANGFFRVATTVFNIWLALSGCEWLHQFWLITLLSVHSVFAQRSVENNTQKLRVSWLRVIEPNAVGAQYHLDK